MRSVVLVGAPRSGGVVAAGLLARAGTSYGGRTAPPTRVSPRGTFASERVAGLNDRLLAAALGAELASVQGGRPGILELASGVEVRASDEDAREMRAIVARRPYCLHDPRFALTLPAWRGALGGAAFVCVFRHPSAAAAAMTERDGVTRTEALRAWCAAHRLVLDVHRRAGDWHFVRHEDLFVPEGRARLAEFLETELAEGFAEPTLLRVVPREDPGAEAAELHRALLALAGAPPPPAEESGAGADASGPREPPNAEPDEPEVAAVVLADEAALPRLPRVLADLRGQRAVRSEIVVVDRTRAGALEGLAGAKVVREPSPSRGQAYRAALEATSAPWIALQDPLARPQPNRLALQLAFARARDGALLVTSDVARLDGERVLRRSFQDPGDEQPAPFWESGMLVRREALAKIDRTAFVPAELDLAARLGRVHRVAHQPELAVGYDAELHDARERRLREDVELVRLARKRGPETPEVTVLMATHDRLPVLLECLEGFARQLLPRKTFEILVVDDASTDGTAEVAADLRLPVPYRYVRRERQAGACAARNAVLDEARGRLVLFVNDDTIPFPDLVRRHLEAHRELGDRRAIVLGTFEQPEEALDDALTRFLERTDHVFGYAKFQPDDVLEGVYFYTCNSSVPAAALREIGPFDESFPCYAEDTDYGVRLEEAGWRVHFRPEARAIHRHLPTFDGLRWRQRAVAKAHVRLFAKHPRLVPSSWARQSLATIRRRMDRIGPFLPELEDACRTLAELDLGAIERAGDECAATARALEERLEELFPKLNKVWWELGFEDGFREAGVDGFEEVLARAAAGRPPAEETAVA